MPKRIGDAEIRLQLARSSRDIQRCKELISEVYLRSYGVILTEDDVDPDGYRERFPDRLAMGLIGDELVACAGLYVGHTYVEEYGGVTEGHLARVLGNANVPGAIRRPRVEYTKVVVRPDLSGQGIGRRFIGMTHCREFLSVGGAPPLLLVCARMSVFRLWDAVGIRTRSLCAFPWYRNHERYRSPTDPMESRLVIPELDIDRRWYDLNLHHASDPEPLGVIHAV